MKGNTIQRVLRVALNLTLNPNYIWFYTKKSFFNKKEPLDLELPWISLKCIHFLNNFLTKNHKVLELGGGGSTIYFSKKVRSVTCFESYDNWAKKIKLKSKSLNLRNIDLRVLPYIPDSLLEFKNSSFFKSISESKFDVIFIDNFENDLQIRPCCFYEAEKSIKRGGIIIIDDSWRYEELRKINSANYFLTFKSIGPCRLGVTTTDVYFY
jgi:hypothetical protein